MIEARKAMIVWNPSSDPNHLGVGVGADGRIDLITPEEGAVLYQGSGSRRGPPVIRVFDNEDQSEHQRYDHMPCSYGACMHDWHEAEDLLPHIFRAFLAVVADGVPVADAHREFLKIDEYHRMLDRREFFGVEVPDAEED